ncbi:signal peptidase I [Nocardioides sp. ChNu-153]|uniref:signal peptidase I n=1 Tax=unclassified Nocardioides TaxID=2615069 RepID=UPI00240749D6|nr:MULTISPECIES: signal peptidase I [unclassified Nocardioides]MDF9716917.1 signal peptidase I [Nocardioides sp. ChNu-99]MDN7122615.1 signal peptidase I [Nocardioides sp. ChNu-153]
MTSDDRESAAPLDEGPGPRSSSSGAPTGADGSEAGGATAVAEAEGGRRSSRRRRKQLPLWQETALLLVVALVLAYVIKAFFLQAFYIPSVSMVPGLQVDDRIVVQKVSYWGGNGPQRGDVVVFEDPGEWLGPTTAGGPSNPAAQVLARIGLYPSGGHLVKRVIGLEGDVVACCDEQGRITVNGQPLDEPYLADGLQCNGPELDAEVCTRVAAGEVGWETGPIPEGHMFVMGDNRAQSEDSAARLCPPNDTNACSPTRAFVDTDLVVGKVLAVVWPRQHWDRLTRPETFASVPDPD